MKNLRLSILLGILIITSVVFYRQIFVVNESNLLSSQNQESEKQSIDTEQQNITNSMLYFNENKQNLTNLEKEVIKLLPSNTILREIEPIPSLGKKKFIGIYIENPIVDYSTDSYDVSCPGEILGQSIGGIYHIFTYSSGIDSDIIIPNALSSVQEISMSWRNTKYNNFNYFHGKWPSIDEANNLEISTLINFEDFNGDGYSHEFYLYDGNNSVCSHIQRLIAGYDKNTDAVIIYKIIDLYGEVKYWEDNFVPSKNGNVIINWPCGDHGADTDTKIFYKYNSMQKAYYLIKSEARPCN